MMLKTMFRKTCYALAILAGVAALPGVSAAQDLGMTPSHVYAMWTNINNALVASAGIVAKNPAAAVAIQDMRARSFSGKKPADVLNRVMTVAEQLDRLRAKYKLKPVKAHLRKNGGKVTPSDVFLNSGRVQDGLLDWMARNTGRQQQISQFYTRRSFSGKSPSDAFSMVDLAARRISRIMAGS